MSTPSANPDIFQEELRELFSELDTALLDLDTTNASPDGINRIFRALHTIKGGCDMMGLCAAVAMLHDLESLWDRVRMRVSPASRELIDLTFAVKDRLAPVAETGRDSGASDALSEALAGLAGRDDGGWARADIFSSGSGSGPEGEARPGPMRSYRISLSPSDPGSLHKGDPESYLDALRGLGQAQVSVDLSGVPALDELDPADCHLRWEVLLTTDSGPDEVRDVFLFLDNPGDALVEELPGDAPPAGAVPASDAVAAPAPVQAPSGTGQAVERAAEKSPGTAASPAASSVPPQPASAPSRPQAGNGKAASREPAQSLRVEAAKLDTLVNLVGELVIAQARLTQIASGANRSDLTGVSEEMGRLVSDLRDNTLGIRMLPIGTTFSRFRRLVRDLSSELGKEIELVAEGGETELDKTVIEQLGDPLVHLLRNCIDHGVEPPEERTRAGKPGRGVIRLSARQSGGAVIISIADDGRGLDTARIREKAVQRGLLAPDARISDFDACQLIFEPGFSTAEKVTSVSGRGVGMDVVKRSIESLRGRIAIDSAPGKGTVITLSLPLTLAIIEGLQVRAGEEFYIIPLGTVEECVELVRQERKGEARGRTIAIRGEIVPYVRLREAFQLSGDPPLLEQVVVTRHENGITGIAVDEVIGQQQTVIKSLGRLIGQVEGISGATINGDGSMALILDVAQLVGSAMRQCEPGA